MRRLRLCGLAAILLATVACAPVERAAAKPGEPFQLTFATLPVTDMLPLYYAMEKGWFRANNLIVDPENLTVANGGGDAVNLLVSKAVDIAFSSYTPFLSAAQKKVADIRIVADGTSAAADVYPVLSVSRSPVRGIQDMRGRRVAITNLFTMSHYKTMSALDTAGIDPATVEFVEVPFPEMGKALNNGIVDAAYVAEPFSELYERQYGAFAAFDSASGPTAEIPMTGYGVRKEWADRQPEVLRSFQKVMVCATDRLRENRDDLNRLAAQHIKGVTVDVANVMAANKYEVSLDPNRLNRVRDLMNAFPEPNALRDFGPVPAVDPLIVRPPTLDEAKEACR